MCFPSPSRTTWPGTLSGPPVLLNLDSVCQICFYTHLTQTDLRVCTHTHPQHTHIHNIHTTHTRHTTHIHIVILGMPQDVTYSHTPFLHLLGSDPETQSDPTVLKVQSAEILQTQGTDSSCSCDLVLLQRGMWKAGIQAVSERWRH